jgi:putative ABC transport system ATP-binding protein
MPIVQAEKVTKVYGEGPTEVVAVEEASLAVERGEMVAIMGPSGSGKTTLLSMLGCILRPTSGRVILAGRDVTDLDEKERPLLRRRHIGFIFQTFNLFSSLTAQENVEVALNLKGLHGKAARGEALRLLEGVGLVPRARHLPRDLSGGEKQRVSIARALAGDPPLILADEPTGNLDWKSGQRIMEILQNAAKEDRRSVVVVTHDSRIEALADRILSLEDGRIRNGAHP